MMSRVSEGDVAVFQVRYREFPGRCRGFPRAMSRVSDGDVAGGTAVESGQQARSEARCRENRKR